MWNGAELEMIEEALHGRLVAEMTILLIETKVRLVEVNDQGWPLTFEFSKNVIAIAHCKTELATIEKFKIQNREGIPNGGLAAPSEVSRAFRPS